MLNQEQIGWLRPVMMTLQIICAALILGATGAAIVLFVVNTNRQFLNSLDPISIMGIAMGFFCFAAAVLIPGIIQKAAASRLADDVRGDGNQVSETTIKKFFEPAQQSTIIRFALCEGAVFGNLVFWFIQGSVFNLAIAGMGLGLMVLMFPFPGRVVQMFENMIEEARHS